VYGEPVLRIQPVLLNHHGIARGLCQDRRGADVGTQGVAIDDGLESAVQPQSLQRGTAVAVDLYVSRMDVQAHERAAHRQVRGFEDVEAVDLLDVRPRHCPRQGAATDLDRQLLALLRVDLLGIAHAANALARIEHYRGGDHRPGQRAPPRFIDAGHQPRRIQNQRIGFAARGHRADNSVAKAC
jgi:hypothetical protein